MTDQLTRRDTLKTVGVAAVAGGSAVPVLSSTASATESGDVEVKILGTIPDNAQISVTVTEYDTESTSSPNYQQTVDFDTTGERESFGNLQGEDSYYYGFEPIEIKANEDSPELEGVILEVPCDQEDFRTIDFTDVLEWNAKPDHVTIEYDEWGLRQYQPLFRMNGAVRERIHGVYGYVARSDEHETDVYCYWAHLEHEQGLPNVGSHSSLGDHVPIYVFVDSATGAVQEVIYSAYHLYVGTLDTSNEQEILEQDRSDAPTHPLMTVVDPWHNCRFTPSRNGIFAELKPWPEVRQTWLQNGFYDSISAEAVENPWAMQDRDSWWDGGVLEGNFAPLWERIGRLLGWWGAEEADRYED